MTESHASVEAWLQEGRPTPPPGHVQDHIDGCHGCRTAIEHADEVIGWFEQDSHEVSADAAEAIKFRLQAEARRARAADAEATAEPRKTRGYWTAAVAVAAVALLGVVSAQWWNPLATGPEPVVPKSGPLATVDAEPGTLLQLLEHAPNEVYRLQSGSAWFSVRKLVAGQQFRVVIGDDVVIVRGTRFQLVAEDGQLVSVNVESGLVTVHLSTGESMDLGKGQGWKRPEVVVEPEPAAPLREEISPVPPALNTPANETKRRRRRAPARTQAAPEPTPEEAAEQEAADEVDARFQAAWQLLRTGRHDAAAFAFDELLRHAGAASRRADILFWSARAHANASRNGKARQRIERLLRDHPNAWHADNAREMLHGL